MAPPRKAAAQVKLQIPAGKATPAPPVGPALGQHGVNIMEFCKAFNAQTQAQEGLLIPVIVTIYQDRAFTFVTKTPPAAVLVKRALQVVKGSGEPNRKKVGKISREKILEIAKLKLTDMNTLDLDSAVRMVAGTCRSMGVEVEA